MRIILKQMRFKRESDRVRGLTGRCWVMLVDGVAVYRHPKRSELVKLLENFDGCFQA